MHSAVKGSLGSLATWVDQHPCLLAALVVYGVGTQPSHLALTSLSLEAHPAGYKVSFLGSAWSWSSGLELYWFPFETQTFCELVFVLIVSYSRKPNAAELTQVGR